MKREGLFLERITTHHVGFLCRWSNLLMRGIPLSATLCTVSYGGKAVFNSISLWHLSQWSSVQSQGDTQPVCVDIKWDKPPRELYSLQLPNRRNSPKTSVREAREHAQSSLKSWRSVNHSSRVVDLPLPSALRSSPSQGEEISTAHVLPTT